MLGFFDYKYFVGWCVDIQCRFNILYWNRFVFVYDVVNIIFFFFLDVVFLVVGVGVGVLVWVVFVDIVREQVVIGVGYVQCVVNEDFDFYIWYLIVDFFNFFQ